MAPVLSLDQTTLLLVKFDNSSSTIAQVTVKHSSTVPFTVDTVVSFALAQAEISNTVTAIVELDVVEAFPTPAIVQTNRYTLLVDSKDWLWGNTMRFTWGDGCLSPAKKKWTFTFLPYEPYV